jgi:hypothetical protein
MALLVYLEVDWSEADPSVAVDWSAVVDRLAVDWLAVDP